jgi:hypothetical protein
MITAEVDTSRLNFRLGEFSDALLSAGRDSEAANVIADESRLFLRDVMRFTPPKTKQQGEDAIARDLNQIFTGVDQMLLDTIGSQHGLNDVLAWFTTSEGKKQEVNWNKIDPSGSGMEAFHLANRNRRGRTRRLKRQNAGRSGWFAPYVVTKEALAEYRLKIQKRVGTKKAAWAVSAMKLGAKVANWVQRHIGHAKGKCIDLLDTPGRPSVTMTSYAPGVGEDIRIVQDALRIRYNSIGKKMKLLAQGITGDWNRGLRIAKSHPGTMGRILDLSLE